MPPHETWAARHKGDEPPFEQALADVPADGAGLGVVYDDRLVDKASGPSGVDHSPPRDRVLREPATAGSHLLTEAARFLEGLALDRRRCRSRTMAWAP